MNLGTRICSFIRQKIDVPSVKLLNAVIDKYSNRILIIESKIRIISKDKAAIKRKVSGLKKELDAFGKHNIEIANGVSEIKGMIRDYNSILNESYSSQRKKIIEDVTADAIRNRTEKEELREQKLVLLEWDVNAINKKIEIFERRR